MRNSESFSICSEATSFESPIGPITVCSDGKAITRVVIGEHSPDQNQSKLLQRAKKLILENLAGKPSKIAVPVRLTGTEFQKAVWDEIAKITFGSTKSYGELASAIGKPAAVRAVGQAVGSNPVPLIIGCHRVLGSSGKITGFSGGDGIETKRKLLAIEKIAVKD